MSTAKEKSLPLAIGLNLLLPGLGYIYMGKWFLGIFACLLILVIYLQAAALSIVPAWIIMNVVMVIDMLILFCKNKKKLVQQNTQKPAVLGSHRVK